MQVNLSNTLLPLLTLLGVLLTGILFWGNIPEATVIQQSELIGQKKVLASSSLEFEKQTVEEGDEFLSFPADLISIEQAIKNVIQKYPGRVTRVELFFGERGPIYEVVVQRGNGALTVVEVDAETGQVLRPLSEREPDNYPSPTLDHKIEI